jgi:Kef-type K+ transport system membrane component KefB
MDITTLLLIMIVVWGTGVVFRRLKLPVLLGELLAGLVFGPALFGVFESNETIKVLAELGVFFLMLHAGLETNPKELFKSSRTAVAIALVSMMFPFTLGTLVALWFNYELLSALFIGLGLSITAIPVTNKIFRDFNFNRTKTAHLVMASAILNDILGFIVLSIMIGIGSKGLTLTPLDIGLIIGKIVLFFGGVIFVGSKVLPYLSNIFQKEGQKAFTFTLVIALAFGVFAEFIGLHYILGAYLAGLFVKEEAAHPAVYQKIEDRLFALSYSFLGPIFFVSLGFNIDFTVLKDPHVAGFLVLIILAAIVGKVVGSGAPAYLSGRSLAESLTIGVSMNARGATELVIALIGFDLFLIDKTVFSILVFMAFFTTLITPIALKGCLKLLGKEQVSETPQVMT